MKQFINILLITGISVISGLLAVGAAYVVAILNNYNIGGVSGVVWLACSFLGGCFFSLIAMLLLPEQVFRIPKEFAILIIIIIISLFIHQWGISSTYLGFYGSYYLPPGFSTVNMSNEELEKLVFNRNNEIGSQAFLELEKRGAKASDSLMHIIQRNMTVAPDVFVDMYTTQEAVRMLAAQKDKRALPILQEMLKSSEYHDSDYMGTHTTFYPTRIFAKKMLKKYFGIESNVETEKRISPKREKR